MKLLEKDAYFSKGLLIHAPHNFMYMYSKYFKSLKVADMIFIILEVFLHIFVDKVKSEIYKVPIKLT